MMNGPDPRWLEKNRVRMQRIDAMEPLYRELVHEYGLTIVDAFMQHELRPQVIRHLIETVLSQSKYGNPRSETAWTHCEACDGKGTVLKREFQKNTKENAE